MKYENKTKEKRIREVKELRERVRILEHSEAECKRMEKEISRQTNFLNLVLESIPHPFYVIDTSDHTIKLANSATHAGLLSERMTCHALTHGSNKPCGSEEHPCPVEIVRETKRLVTVEHIHYDQEGNPRNVEVHAYPIFDPEGNVSEIIESCIDITDRKLAERRLLINNEKLRSLTSALSLAEERERRRIAIEVHDRVAQNLAFAKMELTKMREWLSSGTGSDTADKIIKLLGETIQDTRSLISELGSPILYELGFVPAVQWLTQQTERRRGIKIEFADDGQPKPLSDDIRVILFQAVRELLANVTKHSSAQLAKVSIERNGDRVQVIVEDNGVGFNLATLTPGVNTNSNFGLFSIRERLEPLDGNMEITSEPGHGTRVSLLGPLMNDSEKQEMAA